MRLKGLGVGRGSALVRTCATQLHEPWVLVPKLAFLAPVA